MSAAQETKKLSPFMAVCLVAGTMIGSGIFLLPSSLAAFGGISIWGWIFTTLGALLLALSLSRLSRFIPHAGGPYVYTRVAFGEFAGFLVGWGYWIALLVGLTAVAVAAVGYLGVFLPQVLVSPAVSALIAIAIIWSLVLVNVSGVRQAGIFQVVTLILKLLPLLLVIALGLFFWNGEHFSPMNVSDQSNVSAITATATLTLWAFLGIESATVAAENVENPDRNVARATIYGTLIAALIYIMGSMAVLALVPLTSLVNSTAPFAEAARTVLGSSAEFLVAIGAVISCLGTLNGMTMLLGQMPVALARDGLFHPALKRVSERGTPIPALILAGIIASLFIGLNYSKGLVDLFTYIILLSTLSMLIPLAFSTMAEWMLLVRGDFAKHVAQRKKYLVLSGLAFLYAMWAISGAGKDAVYWGLILFLAGMPCYVFFKWQNQRK